MLKPCSHRLQRATQQRTSTQGGGACFRNQTSWIYQIMPRKSGHDWFLRTASCQSRREDFRLTSKCLITSVPH